MIKAKPDLIVHSVEMPIDEDESGQTSSKNANQTRKTTVKQQMGKRSTKRREVSISTVVATISAGIISASKVQDSAEELLNTRRSCNEETKGGTSVLKVISRGFKQSKKAQLRLSVKEMEEQ